MTTIGWTGVGAIGVGILALSFGIFLRPRGLADPTTVALNHSQNLFYLAPFLGGVLLIILGTTMVARSFGNVLLIQVGVALLLVLVGGSIITFIHQVVAAPEQTLQWPSTEGTILDQYLPVNLIPPPGRFADRSDRDMAKVRYKYRVAGLNYESNRVRFSGTPTSAAYNSLVKQAYQVGARVPVYYNPAAPSEAVLDHETPNTIIKWAGYLAGINFILAGIVAWFLLGRYLGK